MPTPAPEQGAQGGPVGADGGMGVMLPTDLEDRPYATADSDTTTICPPRRPDGMDNADFGLGGAV